MSDLIMNDNVKFHNPNGFSFSKGQVWKTHSNFQATIISVEQFGEGQFDYDVKFSQPDGSFCSKNIWAFQLRYQHQNVNYSFINMAA